MVEDIKYSLLHYIYKNYWDTYILATVRTSDLIISCDPCTFRRTRIRQSVIFLTSKTVANSGKEVGSSGMEISRHFVSCR